MAAEPPGHRAGVPATIEVQVLSALLVGEASGDALARQLPELVDRDQMQGDRPVGSAKVPGPRGVGSSEGARCP